MIHQLIGKPYRLGADGSGPDGAIDCIQLVYRVLEAVDVNRPEFDPHWYEASTRKVMQDLNAWGHRIDRPEYDGDILLYKQPHWAFGVAWEQGCLYINPNLNQVAWTSLHAFSTGRFYRSRGRYAMQSAALKTSIAS